MRLEMLQGCALVHVVNHGRCHCQRRFPQLVGNEMWCGSPGAEFGVLKRIFEFLGCFGCQFQDWMIFGVGLVDFVGGG